MQRAIDPFSHRMRGQVRTSKDSVRGVIPVDSSLVFYQSLFHQDKLKVTMSAVAIGKASLRVCNQCAMLVLS